MTAYEPSFFTQTFPEAIPAGTKPIDRMVTIASDPKSLPGGVRGVNLRMIAGPPRGEEGKYAMNLYLKERGDAKFRSVEDMFATKAFSGEIERLQAVFGANASALDTPLHISHTLRMQNLRRILYKVMADNNLDALGLSLQHGSAAHRFAEPHCGCAQRPHRAAVPSRLERNCPIPIFCPAKRC